MKPTRCGKLLLAVALIGIAALGASTIAGAQYRGAGMGGGGMGIGGHGMMGGYWPGPRGGYEENRQQGFPDLNSGAGRLFAQTCSRCHALPDPRQHTAEQWSGVIERMEQHMRERNLPVPAQNAINDIDAFLAQHANGG